MLDSESTGQCQFCDVCISGRSSIINYCQKCVEELRDDPDGWGEYVREGLERLAAAEGKPDLASGGASRRELAADPEENA